MSFSITPEQILTLYVINQVASALVQALPEPNGNKAYNFFYRFLSLLISDFKSFAQTLPVPTLAPKQLPSSTTSTTTSTTSTVNAQQVPQKDLL